MSDYIYVEEKLIDKLEKVGVTNGKVIMLYAKIQALAEERGYTTAGAPYFCRILNITDRQTRRYLSELESAGCITRFEKRNGAHTEARLIYPKLFVTEEDEYDLGQDCPERTEMTNDLGQKLSDPGQKCPKPRNRKLDKYNTTNKRCRWRKWYSTCQWNRSCSRISTIQSSLRPCTGKW